MNGTVRLAFVVDSTGAVDVATIRVLQASAPEFAAAALRAVRGYRFAPEELNCRRVPIVADEPFAFVRPM